MGPKTGTKWPLPCIAGIAKKCQTRNDILAENLDKGSWILYYYHERGIHMGSVMTEKMLEGVKKQIQYRRS
jgi:hypothetical protein